MTDLLRMDYINSLPQPFYVRLVGDTKFDWPVYDFAVDAAIFRIDVCGLLEVKSMADAAEFRDADGVIHDADSFWSDYEEQLPATPPPASQSALIERRTAPHAAESAPSPTVRMTVGQSATPSDEAAAQYREQWFADVRRCLEDVSTEMRAHGRSDFRFQQLIQRMAGVQS